MHKTSITLALAISGLAWAGPALAASDYLLEIDGVKGESKATIELESWSFGVCNPGACTASSSQRVTSPPNSGRRSTVTQNSQSLRESPTRASSGGVRVAVGDIDGDGRADLAFVGTQAEIGGFSTTARSNPALIRICQDQRIGHAMLRSGGDTFELTDARLTCSRVDGGGQVDALTDGLLIVRYLSGQMKHTKTGHVTLLK